MQCTPGELARLGPFRPWNNVPTCSYGPRELRLDGCDRMPVGCVIVSRPDSWHVCSSAPLSQADNHLTLPPRPIIFPLPHALGGWVDDQESNTANQQPASPGRADDWPFLSRSSVLYCMILRRVLATPDLLISGAGPLCRVIRWIQRPTLPVIGILCTVDVTFLQPARLCLTICGSPGLERQPVWLCPTIR